VNSEKKPVHNSNGKVSICRVEVKIIEEFCKVKKSAKKAQSERQCLFSKNAVYCSAFRQFLKEVEVCGYRRYWFVRKLLCPAVVELSALYSHPSFNRENRFLQGAMQLSVYNNRGRKNRGLLVG